MREGDLVEAGRRVLVGDRDPQPVHLGKRCDVSQGRASSSASTIRMALHGGPRVKRVRILAWR